MTERTTPDEIVGADSNQYWRLYQLSGDPFETDTINNASLYYPVASFGQHIDLMTHLVNYSNVMLVVSGEATSGKTTLKAQFLSQLENNAIQIFAETATPDFSVTQLVQTLANGFDLPIPEEEALEVKLNMQLSELQYQPLASLLIFDDAHLLSDETLKALLHLVSQQSDTQMRLHILLFGETALANKLSSLSQEGQPDLVHTIRLANFDEAETGQYILYRLSRFGHAGKSPLNKHQIARIYQLTGGNPGRINQVAKKELQDALLQPQKRAFLPKWKLPKLPNWRAHKKMLLLSLFVLALLVGVSVLSEYFLPSSSVASPAEAKITEKSTISEANAVGKMETPSAEETSENLPSIAVKPKAEPVKQQAAVLPDISSVAKTPALPVTERKVENVTQSEVRSEPVKTDVIEQAKLPETTKPVTGKATTQKLAEKTAKPASDLKIPPRTLQKITKQPEAVKPQPATQKPIVQPENLSARFTADEKAVLRLPPDRYTLQLISAHHPKSVRDFLREHFKGHKKNYYVVQLGKHWHAVVFGSYRTDRAAHQAVKQLPRGLGKPWVRQLRDVQQFIRQK